MKYKKIFLAIVFSVFVFAAFAYIPENKVESSFEEMIVNKSAAVTDIVMNGIKEVSKEIVETKYEDNEVVGKSRGVAARKASGSESVSADTIMYYEAKEEMLDAEEGMDEINQWIVMYQTKKGDDVVTFKKMKKYLVVKDAALRELVEVLKLKNNKTQVMKIKKTLLKADKDFNRYKKLLKGKIELIPGKALPEAKE